MQNLIDEVFELVKDYRADEGDTSVMMTPDRIKRWVEQFDTNDREFILSELVKVFGEHYCRKEDALHFLKDTINSLAIASGYDKLSSFLYDTYFLDLQGEAKSQKILINLLAEWLIQEHNFDFALCGTNEPKNFVYLDDIFCTGNTLFHDIKKWVELPFKEGVTFEELLKTKQIKLSFAYIFVHLKNYLKKKYQFEKAKLSYISTKMENLSSNKSILHSWILIDNKNFETCFDVGLLIPQEKHSFDEAVEYTHKVIQQVDSHTDENEFARKLEEFYRPNDKPTEETFFTSPEARTRFEDIMLRKGLEIISKTQNAEPRMKPLGYTLPSEKSFGFGALCFTWRNVPNTTPLAFWSIGGGHYPLFVRKH